MNPYPLRRERLAAQIREEGIPGVLVSNPVNVTYLTGFSGESSPLILTPHRTVVVSDGRFTQQIAEECPGLEAHIRPPAQSIPEAVATVLNKMALSEVGFESAHMTVADLQQLSDQAKTIAFKGATDRVEKLRQIKDAEEVEQIRASIRMAEKAFAMFRACLRPGDNEKELVDALEQYVRRAGGRGSAFPPIVAVGARAALPHAPPSLHRVEEAPLLLVDWGATGPFYKSDLTRVLLTHNNAAAPGTSWEPGQRAKVRQIYEVVLQAQTAAMAAVRPGAKAGEVDGAARQVIADAGFGDFFTHSIGHGFGLQIHEAPFMRPGSDLVLRAGMVVTVEPGIYVPDLAGVRIEDDLLITPDGHEVLTRLPRSFEENVIEW